jgi:hypothetical protein
MLHPSKQDISSSDDVYSCPDQTRGSHYRCPARISLIDTQSHALINTVTLSLPYEQDSFDVPYRISGGLFYLVPGHDKHSEGKPKLLALRDINGDGLALEAVFFDAEACMGLQTTLFGYSVKQDRVIQYQVEVSQNGEKPAPQVWTDYLFSKESVSPGHWAYMIDYSGRGGCQDAWRVRYDAGREKFFATLSQANCIEIK